MFTTDHHHAERAKAYADEAYPDMATISMNANPGALFPGDMTTHGEVISVTPDAYVCVSYRDGGTTMRQRMWTAYTHVRPNRVGTYWTRVYAESAEAYDGLR